MDSVAPDYVFPHLYFDTITRDSKLGMMQCWNEDPAVFVKYF